MSKHSNRLEQLTTETTHTGHNRKLNLKKLTERHGEQWQVKYGLEAEFYPDASGLGAYSRHFGSVLGVWIQGQSSCSGCVGVKPPKSRNFMLHTYSWNLMRNWLYFVGWLWALNMLSDLAKKSWRNFWRLEGSFLHKRCLNKTSLGRV